MTTYINEWLSKKAQERKRLYEKYGKPLEEEHAGEFVAIAHDGRVIWGRDDGEVLRKAVDQMGSGNFVLARVSHPTFGKRLALSR